MKKYLFTALLAVAGITGANATVINGIDYDLKSFSPYTATVKQSSTNNALSGVINIPESFVYSDRTYYVTEIAANAFNGNENITEVHLPETMEKIGGYAFQDCINLEYCNIPPSITSITQSAFQGCVKLSNPIQLPAATSTGTYGGRLFQDCAMLPEFTFLDPPVLQKPASAYSLIMSAMLQNCVSLKSIRLPNYIMIISNAFLSGCSGLETVTTGIYNNQLNETSFNDCTSLRTLILTNTEEVVLAHPHTDAERDRGTNTFGNVDMTLVTVYVPANLLSEYQADYFWSSCGATLKTLDEMETPEPVLTIADLAVSTVNPMGTTATVTATIEAENFAEDAAFNVYYKLDKAPYENYTEMAYIESQGYYSADLSGLTPGTEYTVSVYAKSGDVESEVTTQGFTTPIPAPELNDFVVETENVTGTTADIVVTYSVAYATDQTVAGVKYKAADADDWTAVEGTLKGLTINLTDLERGKEYEYEIYPTLNGNQAGMQTSVFFTTEPPLPEAVLLSAATEYVGSSSVEFAVKYETAYLPEGSKVYAIATESETRGETRVEATESPVTIRVEGLELDTEYNFMIVIEVQDSEGGIITRSNIDYLTFTTNKTAAVTDIESDMAGGARYFNLQGVEIAKPAPGNIYIRVNGNKAAKVMVK